MNVIIDLSNICWIKRFGHLKSKKYDPYGKQLIIQETLKEIFNAYKKYHGTNLIIAVDGRNTWRKQKYPFYKATRDTEFDIYFDDVKEAISNIQGFFNDVTNCYCVQVDSCEADDVVATVCKRTNDPCVIVSSDKDFIQLMKDYNIKLYDPMKKDERTSDDPKYDLFLKCFRGDSGDNIRSAYPRVREKRIKEAYTDPYAFYNILNEKRVDGELVSDYYYFNKMLIDLDEIPKDLEDEISKELKRQQEEPNKYSYSSVLRYLRDLGIKQFAMNTMDNHVFILKNKSSLFQINKLQTKHKRSLYVL